MTLIVNAYAWQPGRKDAGSKLFDMCFKCDFISQYGTLPGLLSGNHGDVVPVLQVGVLVTIDHWGSRGYAVAYFLAHRLKTIEQSGSRGYAVAYFQTRSSTYMYTSYFATLYL